MDKMQHDPTNYMDTIAEFTTGDKDFYLSDPTVIDYGIKELVDAINSIDVLFTMKSCQGALIISEKDKHCPITYVDFYVLYHQYHIAQNLMVSLVNEFGIEDMCKMEYDPDFDRIFDRITEDEYEANGLVDLRFRIKIFDTSYEDLKYADSARDTYEKVVEHVKDFSEIYHEKLR